MTEGPIKRGALPTWRCKCGADIAAYYDGHQHLKDGTLWTYYCDGTETFRETVTWMEKPR